MPVRRGYQVVPVDHFWPRHWFWYVLLGFACGFLFGQSCGGGVYINIPEGPGAERARRQFDADI